MRPWDKAKKLGMNENQLVGINCFLPCGNQLVLHTNHWIWSRMVMVTIAKWSVPRMNSSGHPTPSLMWMALLKCLHACQASQKSIVIRLCQRRHDQCCSQAGTASVTGKQASPRQKEFLTPSNCSFISGMAMMDLKNFQHWTFHFCF